MKRKISLIPSYTILPLAAAIFLHCAAFYGTRLITAGSERYDLAVRADSLLPLVPPFIIIYILAYIQWIAGFILLCREKRELCFETLAGEMIGKLICAAVFIALPTVMVRPEVVGDGVFSRLVRLVYYLDAPDNLFPSLHCYESWFCFRCALRSGITGRRRKIASFIFTLAVFASVVLVKQHRIVDIIGGISIVEIGLFLSKKLGAGRIFEKFPTIKINLPR